jgi:hypothetical protein
VEARGPECAYILKEACVVCTKEPLKEAPEGTLGGGILKWWWGGGGGGGGIRKHILKTTPIRFHPKNSSGFILKTHPKNPSGSRLNVGVDSRVPWEKISPVGQGSLQKEVGACALHLSS